jgi:anti-sigma regulatory factor (Ser/Thr protein kinase)
MYLGQSLIESYPAVAQSVPRAREALAAFAAEGGATREEIDAVRLAASEALTNVVAHAYRDRGARGRIHLTVALTDGELWVIIGDDGCGLHADRDSHGLGAGLALIAQSSDGFALVKRAAGGTEVRMRFDLSVAQASRGSADVSIRLLAGNPPPCTETGHHRS